MSTSDYDAAVPDPERPHQRAARPAFELTVRISLSPPVRRGLTISGVTAGIWYLLQNAETIGQVLSMIGRMLQAAGGP